MLTGIDISHHNENLILKNPELLNQSDFVIMKATEGISYEDKYKEKYISLIDRSTVHGIGFYHYARPERGNSPEMEASYFLCHVVPYLNLAVLALDVEGDALLYPDIDDWTYRFLEYVRFNTGVRPLVYCSESQCYRFTKAAKNDYGLWVAKWGEKKPVKAKIKPWKFWAIWQNEVRGVDRDIFNGDISAWFAYASGGSR